MTTTKSIEQVREEAIACMQKAITEIASATVSVFVVAYVGDGCPLRESGDGTVRLLGDHIYSTTSAKHAKRIADGYNAQLKAKGIEGGVAVERATEWRKRRVTKLHEYVELLKSQG